MKAKCPHCQTGCGHCDGGYVEASFATGDLYTRDCPDCGFQNGGRIAFGPFADPTSWEPPRPCVDCGGERVRWLKVGVMNGGK